MSKEIKLQKILSSHFLKFSLIPIIIVEVTLLILYFSINQYISIKNTNLLLNEAQFHSHELLKNEANFINDKLLEVSRLAQILQREHEKLFQDPKKFILPNGEPTFEVASNGVYYKTNHIGASLYYSSKTKMTKETKYKALFTESMDTSLESIVNFNPNIVAAYFNSWDNMNRLYPFINKVYEQYGNHIQMEDYNFYYLADNKHNPSHKPVWTTPYLDPAGNGWMLSCIVPIYKNDFLEGVTGLDITIDSFVKNILNRKLSYNANLFLMDENAMIIAMSEKIEKPEEFNILKSKSPFAEHFKNLIKSNLNSSTLNIKDKEYLTLKQDIKETNWKLMILIDKDEIFSSIVYLQNLSNKIGYITIIILVFLYIIFFYFLINKINKFSYTITKPIKKLSNQTSQIKTTSAKVNLISTNILEIQQLNNNFERMMNELKERTNKLYESKILAEELAKSKDDFLANMSHELKTPLNSINVISDVMMRNKTENLDEKQIKNIGIINKCGKDLLYLINDVLDISKLEAGQIILNNDTINIKDLIMSIYDMFYPQTKAKEIDFVLKVDDSLETMYSDEDRIKQIIKNLLSNALKFTESGKISLIVKDEDKDIKVIVKDEGIGIPEDKLENIFDRFKQVDGSTTRKYGGTGLGLAICKELAHLLKGDITVTSELGKGSTFELIICKNIDLIQGLEVLSLSTETSNSIKDTSPNEEIYILNSNPILFFKIISQISSKYNIIYIKDLKEINLSKDTKIILEASSLKEEDIIYIKEYKINNLILITEGKINKELDDLVILSIDKSLENIDYSLI
jgi:signal transduction histidine kinase